MSTVSVILTFYNRTEYIQAALESVSAQTRKADQVLVVDDASRAEAASYLDRVAGGATVIHLPRNVGLAGARNEGIARAKGELIAFLDDDDVWMAEKVAVQAHYMDEHPDVEATHTGVVAFFRDGSERVYDRKPSPLRLEDSMRIAHIVPSCLMVRADALRRLGCFDATLRFNEELDLQIRMVAAGWRVEFLPAALLRFRRQQHGNLSSQWRARLEGDMRLLGKHGELYRRVYGEAGERLQKACVLYRVGQQRGGLGGRLMRIQGRLLNGGARPRFL